MKFTKNRAVAGLITLVGLVFLVFPLLNQSYEHYLQNQAYHNAQQTTVSCRAKLALEVVSHPVLSKSLERYLDTSCGVLPQYNDFVYEPTNPILTVYQWLAQKVTFIPI
jgi:transposase-like protein